MTVRSPTILVLLVLVGTALSAMGGLPPAPGADPARPSAPGGAKADLLCGLSLSPLGAGTAVLARVTAAETAPAPVSGRYSLTLRSGGNAIDQGGDFEARPGETVTLGEATLPGAPEALEGELTVTAEGRSVACPREVR